MLKVHRGQTTNSGALFVSWQDDFRAEVGLVNLQTEFLLELWHRTVAGVDEV